MNENWTAKKAKQQNDRKIEYEFPLDVDVELAYTHLPSTLISHYVTFIQSRKASRLFFETEAEAEEKEEEEDIMCELSGRTNVEFI